MHHEYREFEIFSRHGPRPIGGPVGGIAGTGPSAGFRRGFDFFRPGPDDLAVKTVRKPQAESATTMVRIAILTILWTACSLLPGSAVLAARDGEGWQELATFRLAAPALDTAVSPDGRWVYVLAEGGRLLVYTADGTLKDTLELGTDVGSVAAGPGEGILYLTGPSSDRLRVVEVALQYDFDLSGSPTKGPGDAPVVMVVFSDFQ